MLFRSSLNSTSNTPSFPLFTTVPDFTRDPMTRSSSNATIIEYICIFASVLNDRYAFFRQLFNVDSVRWNTVAPCLSCMYPHRIIDLEL